MKGVETGVCQNNDGGTRTLSDGDILNKTDVLWPPKKMLWLKQDSLFNMIIFLLEKVIRCAQMSWLLKGVETGDSRIQGR